jgi:hypothetical protein
MGSDLVIWDISQLTDVCQCKLQAHLFCNRHYTAR